MIDAWLQTLSEVLSQNLWIGLLISLAAGLLTSFTPCSLSSVPLIIGYVGGYTDNKKRAFFYSLMFCIGMAIVFTALGVVSALVGRLFLGIQMYWYIILGILMFVMALQTWGIIHIFPQKCSFGANSKTKGAIGAYVMGMVGAIFASPCSTPVLIAIMAVVSTGQSIVMGILMLLLYSLGHSVLIVIAGTFVGFANEISHSEKFDKASKIIKIIMGIMLMAFSAYLFYSAFAG
ncbi:MAG: cytochrome c biogenesis CcdA family protein [Candidatus Coproplasma sp.]